MKEIKQYYCSDQPTEYEIREGMNIANYEHCIVILIWNVNYFGTYKMQITEDCTYRSCEDQIPKYYPV